MYSKNCIYNVHHFNFGVAKITAQNLNPGDGLTDDLPVHYNGSSLMTKTMLEQVQLDLTYRCNVTSRARQTGRSGV